MHPRGSTKASATPRTIRARRAEREGAPGWREGKRGWGAGISSTSTADTRGFYQLICMGK